MLIYDSAHQERIRWRKAVERTRAVAASALEHQQREVRKTAETETAHGILNPSDSSHQTGQPMTSNELLGRLKRMNGNLQIVDGSEKNSLAILYPAKEKQPDGGEKIVLRFLCGLEKGFMPEWSILHPVYEPCWDAQKRDFVDTLRTLRETRGWRTVIDRVMGAKLATVEKVAEYFPVYAPRKVWMEKLKMRGATI